ncbi:TetR family transcriptional regulator [Amycolatopsis sp. NBRC 101858]|uniref:TetR/AcrR family transcriptional regulator n=1 Tax=Amycolatopsis sp. NBRC 101858 TaxID=3032200 RepID=UPI0024A4A590|nr:TetR/AcrR family transcriptional regulator C-terminal domain-containing protein [Amycolatopsis sp. NBRC 101858]GLY43183.1 TetR family transcriptional regulator [Amycolatopsis sp. NBRC 101858]
MPSRDPFRASHVASRRNRPAKPPLSRDAIVAEALRQISQDGGGMSLRKIATALDTGPASLYAYVDDLSELQALVLDHALDEVTVGAAGEPWRARLERLLRSYAEVLAKSPALAQLAFQTVAVGPNALRIAEALLEILDEAGVEPATAAWAIDMLTMSMAAAAAGHAYGLDPAAPDSPVAQAVDRVSADEYPRVHAARADIMSGTGDERFAWSVDVLIRGILARP